MRIPARRGGCRSGRAVLGDIAEVCLPEGRGEKGGMLKKATKKTPQPLKMALGWRFLPVSGAGAAVEPFPGGVPGSSPAPCPSFAPCPGYNAPSLSLPLPPVPAPRIPRGPGRQLGASPSTHGQYSGGPGGQRGPRGGAERGDGGAPFF